MAGTRTTSVLRRNKAASSSTPSRAIVKLRPDALKELFAAEGIKGLRNQVAELNRSGTAALSGAYNGGAVSAGLSAAVRLRFPHVPYKQLFIESEGPTAAQTP